MYTSETVVDGFIGQETYSEQRNSWGKDGEFARLRFFRRRCDTGYSLKVCNFSLSLSAALLWNFYTRFPPTLYVLRLCPVRTVLRVHCRHYVDSIGAHL